MNKRWNWPLPGLIILFLVTGCEESWQSRLNRVLPVMGHRNWILIADSAYPSQSGSGIETIWTGEDHIYVVKTVLRAIDEANHINATVYLDAELESVTEELSPGVERFRKELTSVISNHTVKSKPHEELINTLDSVSETFNVLILKTNLTIPYTSLFLELGCGYWD